MIMEKTSNTVGLSEKLHFLEIYLAHNVKYFGKGHD